jgi:hypothetical protein
MISEAMNVAHVPRSRAAHHSAAVPATMAMISERITSAGVHSMSSGMRIAYMPM